MIKLTVVGSLGGNAGGGLSAGLVLTDGTGLGGTDGGGVRSCVCIVL